MKLNDGLIYPVGLILFGEKLRNIVYLSLYLVCWVKCYLLLNGLTWCLLRWVKKEKSDLSGTQWDG